MQPLLPSYEDKQYVGGAKKVCSPPMRWCDTPFADGGSRVVSPPASLSSRGHGAAAAAKANAKRPTTVGAASRTGLTDKRGFDARDVEELCDLCAHKLLRGIGNEVLRELKSAMRDELMDIKRDLTERVEARERKLEGLSERLTALGSEGVLVNHNVSCDSNFSGKASMGAMGTAPLDMLLSEVQRELMQGLQGELCQSVSKILEEVHCVKRQQERSEQVLLSQIQDDIKKLQLGSDVEVFATRSEAQMDKVIAMQTALGTNLAQHVQNMQEVQSDAKAELEPLVDSVVAKQLQSVTAELGSLHKSVGRITKATQQDMATLLTELAKVQQALNLDFAQVLDGLGDIKNKANEKDEEEEKKKADDARMSVFNPDSLAAAPVQRTKRMRDWMTQTHQEPTVSSYSQTDPHLLDDAKKQKRKPPEHRKIKPPKAVFADADELKKKAPACLQVHTDTPAAVRGRCHVPQPPSNGIHDARHARRMYNMYAPAISCLRAHL
eukprot:TRINITY_DN13169_c0_g1_i2.p1 TRINITY_DN13169_c0_g1~~TRINITY_DN13169_c0_g1_i2.p1  ORF type:complete len:495 (-),score=122.35 TRINITY_DN13169_c0_g1_i2:36-1520(-)